MARAVDEGLQDCIRIELKVIDVLKRLQRGCLLGDFRCGRGNDVQSWIGFHLSVLFFLRQVSSVVKTK